MAALKAHNRRKHKSVSLSAPTNDNSRDLVYPPHGRDVRARGGALASLPDARAANETPPDTPADLRYTWASLALQAGVPVKVVSEILGQASVKITYDIYSHEIPVMAEDATSRVAALLFPAHN